MEYPKIGQKVDNNVNKIVGTNGLLWKQKV